MTLRIGTPISVPVANCLDLEKARKADLNHDGDIDLREAASIYEDGTHGRTLTSVGDVYQVLGGARHTLRTYPCPDWAGEYGVGPYSYHTMLWQGDFYVDGAGAGSVKTRHNYHFEKSDYSRPPIVSVLVAIDCDMFSSDFIAGIESASLVLGPRGFPQIEGTGLPEAVEVPLDVFTAPEEAGSNELSGRRYTIPAVKMLVADINRDDLVEVAGETGGISFFVEVRLKDGRRVYFERDDASDGYFDLSLDFERASRSSRR